MLFRGAQALRRVPHGARLLAIPIAINALLFVIVAAVLMTWGLQALFTWIAPDALGAVLTWAIRVFVFLLLLLLYAFVFPIVAEVVGAPFYEEIGARLDRAAGVAVVERGWRQEIALMIGQESRKLALMFAVGVVIIFLQFAPIVGQALSVALGFFLLVLTLGSDAVAPALSRRGLLLRDRRVWVSAHWPAVAGLGMAKAAGLFVPLFNIVVLPMAAAGGTLLVQSYEKAIHRSISNIA